MLTDEQKKGLEKLREEIPESLIETRERGMRYLGHAAATKILLDADLEWSWRPLALDSRGLPAFDEIGGLWIVLTVQGRPMLGYGSAKPVQNSRDPGDRFKEVIGDALRNAGCRMGLGLQLWAKTDLYHAEKSEETPPQQEPEKPEKPEKRKMIWGLLKDKYPQIVSNRFALEMCKAATSSGEDLDKFAHENEFKIDTEDAQATDIFDFYNNLLVLLYRYEQK